MSYQDEIQQLHLADKSRNIHTHTNKRFIYTIFHNFNVQESAAYATVSARQSRHLVNSFEVAAIECLNCVGT